MAIAVHARSAPVYTPAVCAWKPRKRECACVTQNPRRWTHDAQRWTHDLSMQLQRAYLDLPMVRRDFIQLQCLVDLGRGECTRQVLFVGKDEQRRTRQALFPEQDSQLGLAVLQPHPVGAVDDLWGKPNPKRQRARGQGLVLGAHFVGAVKVKRSPWRVVRRAVKVKRSPWHVVRRVSDIMCACVRTLEPAPVHGLHGTSARTCLHSTRMGVAAYPYQAIRGFEIVPPV